MVFNSQFKSGVPIEEVIEADNDKHACLNHAGDHHHRLCVASLTSDVLDSPASSEHSTELKGPHKRRGRRGRGRKSGRRRETSKPHRYSPYHLMTWSEQMDADERASRRADSRWKRAFAVGRPMAPPHCSPYDSDFTIDFDALISESRIPTEQISEEIITTTSKKSTDEIFSGCDDFFISRKNDYSFLCRKDHEFSVRDSTGGSEAFDSRESLNRDASETVSSTQNSLENCIWTFKDFYDWFDVKVAETMTREELLEVVLVLIAERQRQNIEATLSDLPSDGDSNPWLAVEKRLMELKDCIRKSPGA